MAWTDPTIVTSDWNIALKPQRITGPGGTPIDTPEATAAAPKSTPTTSSSSTFNADRFAKFGDALSGAKQFQDSKRQQNPWAAEASGFDMSGVGQLMNTVGVLRSLGGK